MMRSARDRWSFSKLDEILESVAESRIQQEEATARTEVSDAALISQHTIGVDVPGPSVCPAANVDAAEEDQPGIFHVDVSIDSVETQNGETGVIETPVPVLPADEFDVSVEAPSEETYADRCEDSADDTFDRVACRLVKVRRGDVRRRRLKWMAVGLSIAIPLAGGAAIGREAIRQRPEAPFAWVWEQAHHLVGELFGSPDTDEPADDQL